MVPQTIVVLDELPVLPNGKIDRARLPEVGREAEGGEGAGAQQGPRTAVEEMVAGSWRGGLGGGGGGGGGERVAGSGREVLGVGRVGVEENFFELGGHSLLATQVMSRVREMFGVEVALRRLFESPTVAGLALAIVQGQAEQSESDDIARL